MKKTAFALATAFTLTTAAFGATADAASHKVQSGDTLWDISQKYNTSVEQIMQDNSLQSSLIFPNDVLEVNEAGSNLAPQVATSTYIVAPGDTLEKISQKVNVSIANLVAWNAIASADNIYTGDILALTEASKSLAQVTTIQVAQTAPAAKATPVAQQKAAKPAAQSQQKAQQAVRPAQAQQTQAAAPAGNGAQTLSMSATAYTAYCNGCSGITANGTNLRANPGLKVIAVDPRVIPLGTKVWVEGYGTAIAADTGGAIKGNKIDVFIPTQEGALAWGRKTVTVKILN